MLIFMNFCSQQQRQRDGSPPLWLEHSGCHILGICLAWNHLQNLAGIRIIELQCSYYNFSFTSGNRCWEDFYKEWGFASRVYHTKEIQRIITVINYQQLILNSFLFFIKEVLLSYYMFPSSNAIDFDSVLSLKCIFLELLPKKEDSFLKKKKMQLTILIARIWISYNMLYVITWWSPWARNCNK